jgi:hypothetical protein
VALTVRVVPQGRVDADLEVLGELLGNDGLISKDETCRGRAVAQVVVSGDPQLHGDVGIFYVVLEGMADRGGGGVAATVAARGRCAAVEATRRVAASAET